MTQGTRLVCCDHQELHPTERPDFEITNIRVNESGTRAALWGSKGVFVMDLPWRCGPRLEYQDGKASIVTRCRQVNDLELGYGSEVTQVRWNPSSVNDSGLVVLVSDNSLYQFDMMPVNCYNFETIQLGDRPYSLHRTLAALGETAVDFCFAPIYIESDNSQQVGATVLLVLRGNGDVSLVFGDSDENSTPEGQILPIYPLREEYYFGDACSLLAISGKPSGVVIATTRGVLYHALLVPLNTEELDVHIRYRKYRLLVVESVALEMRLLSVPDDLSAFPLRLFLDPCHPRRYLVVHPSGIHSVFMGVLSGVEDLIQSPAVTSTPNKMPQSSLEYLLCTGRALIGCTALPYTLIAIDAERNVIVLPLRRIELLPLQLFAPGDEKESEQSPLTRQMRQPFREQVEHLLQETRVLPLVKLPKEDLPREQLLAAIVRMSSMVRKQTIPKFRQVRSILAQRVQLITAMRALQLEELARLEAERSKIKSVTEGFGERINKVSENLDEHRTRVQKIVRHVAEVSPTQTDAELRMQITISDIEEKLEDYNNRLVKLKQNHAYQEMKIEQQPVDRNLTLGNKQTETIRSCLTVIGENVAQLVRRVNALNEKVRVSTD